MSSMSNLTTTDAPHWNGEDNHGPLVSLLTWFFVITAFLAVLARVLTRLHVIRKLRWDDGSIMAAMVRSTSCLCWNHLTDLNNQVLCIAHSVTTSLQVTNGLGKHIDRVSQSNLIWFQKVREIFQTLRPVTIDTFSGYVCFRLSIHCRHSFGQNLHLLLPRMPHTYKNQQNHHLDPGRLHSLMDGLESSGTWFSVLFASYLESHWKKVHRRYSFLDLFPRHQYRHRSDIDRSTMRHPLEIAGQHEEESYYHWMLCLAYLVGVSLT